MAYTYETEIFGYAPQPQCEPIADKPWSCGGVNEVDRYDCINGVITLTEKNSTACGYQEPSSEVEQPVGIDMANVLKIFGIAALGGFILFLGADTMGH